MALIADQQDDDFYRTITNFYIPKKNTQVKYILLSFKDEET
jgi:hypothetical protein